MVFFPSGILIPSSDWTKELNLEKIQEAVGSYLKKKEIKAILTRRELLLKEIEEMIKEKGEDKVLY